MSFSAFVAYERGDGKYDIYHSHNGAENYMLKPVLEQYLEGDVPKDAGGVPAVMPAEVNSIARDTATRSGVELEAPDHDLINSDPSFTGVEESEIGNSIDFYSHEAGYIVRDWQVEVYLPILASPLVLNTLRLRVEARIYGRDEIGGLESIDRIHDTDPMWTLAGDDFTPEGLDRLDPEPRQLLEDRHIYFLDNYQKVTANSTGNEIGVFTTEDYIVEIRPQSTDPLAVNAGVFIRVPWDEQSEPKYQWHGGDDTHPATVASRIRLEEASDFDSEGQDLADARDASGLGKMLLRNQTKFFMRIYREFGDDLSEEFVPQKYAELIRKGKAAIDARD